MYSILCSSLSPSSIPDSDTSRGTFTKVCVPRGWRHFLGKELSYQVNEAGQASHSKKPGPLRAALSQSLDESAAEAGADRESELWETLGTLGGEGDVPHLATAEISRTSRRQHQWKRMDQHGWWQCPRWEPGLGRWQRRPRSAD